MKKTDGSQHGYVLIQFNKENEIANIEHITTYNDVELFIENVQHNGEFHMGDYINVYGLQDTYSAKFTKDDIETESVRKKDGGAKRTSRSEPKT